MSLKQTLRKLASQYDPELKVAFRAKPIMGAAGIYSLSDVRIELWSEKADEELIQTFFHELGHWFCYKHDVYHRYHWGELNGLWLQNAILAERWVEEWGRMECAKVFPEVRWKKRKLISNRAERKWMMDWMNRYYAI